MVSKYIILIVLISLTLSSGIFGAEDYNDNWPTWRGPLVTGTAVKGAPPTQWGEGKNVKWKTPVPGKGLSTPVIWGDQIFITTAIKLDQKAAAQAVKKHKKASPTFLKILRMSKTTDKFIQFVVYSINRTSGKVNWRRVARQQYPHEGVQVNGSWASASCVTDGERVIASFGSYGIYCFDMQGSLIWEKDLGDMHVYAAWGEGASPVIYQDNLVIVWDHEGQSKIYVLNKKTGEEIWHKDRDEKTTWSTPVVAQVGDIAQIVVSGKKMSRGYNMADGEIIWNISGLAGDIIPSPIYDGEIAFLMTGSIGAKKIIQAINLRVAKGNLKNSKAVIWTCDKNTSYIPSPLLSGDKLYFLKSNNTHLSCVGAKTGKNYYQAQKVKGMKSAYASPVCANGNIYIIDRKGTCAVIREGAEFAVIAQNKLNDNFDASPAIAGNDLILRGLKNLYCISE